MLIAQTVDAAPSQRRGAGERSQAKRATKFLLGARQSRPEISEGELQGNIGKGKERIPYVSGTDAKKTCPLAAENVKGHPHNMEDAL